MEKFEEITEEHLARAGWGGGKLVVLEFAAPKCGPCENLAQALNGIAGSLEGRLEIFRVDIERQPGFARRFGVVWVPTMIFFLQGREVWRTVGALTTENLSFIWRLLRIARGAGKGGGLARMASAM